MGSTKKRRVPRKSTTTKLREEIECLKRENRFLRSDADDAMRALKESLPPSKTERVYEIAQLARLAAHAANVGQIISSGATKALRAAGYMPTGPEDVAARIGGALFLKEGQIVVEKWQADALRERFEDIFGDDA